MAPPHERPSKKQRELLNYIDGFVTGYGYGPSYREIMRALNYKSVSTVATHIDGLIAKGFLMKKDNSARSLIVVSGSEMPTSIKPMTKPQQKWLVDQIDHRIRLYEEQPSAKLYDDIGALIKSLAILGFENEAKALEDAYKQLSTNS